MSSFLTSNQFLKRQLHISPLVFAVMSCALLLLICLPLYSQQSRMTTWTTVSQNIDADSLRSKQFRFSALVKSNPSNEFGRAQLYFRVDRESKKKGFFNNMSDRPIKANQWKRFVIQGKIDEDAVNIQFGIIGFNHGEYFIDDVRIDVHDHGSIWKPIRFPNAGFEESQSKNPLNGWGGRVEIYNNFIVEVVRDAPEGEQALKILCPIAYVVDENIVSEQNINLRFEKLGRKEGMPHSQIYSIHQDKQGYIWFGTGDGLARYDGYEFMKFKHDPEDSLSLSNNVVTAIADGFDGSLWVGTTLGLNRYDPVTGEFQRFFHLVDDSFSISDNHVTTILPVDDHKIWIGTRRNGLNLFNPKLKKFIRYQPAFKEGIGFFPNGPVNCMVEGTDGSLWLGIGNSGLVRFHEDTGIVENFLLIEYASSGASYIHSILPLKQSQTLLVGTNGGLLRFDTERRKFEDIFHRAGKPFEILGLRASENLNEVWMLFDEGLGLFKLHDNTLSYPFQKPGLSEGIKLPDFRTPPVLVDREGIFWIGSDNGVYYYNHMSNRFLGLNKKTFLPRNVDNEIVTSVQITEDYLWCTMEDGLGKIHLEDGNFEFLDRKITDDFECNLWTNLFHAVPNKIWVQKYRDLFVEIDPESNNVTEVLIKNKNQRINYVHCMRPVAGDVWIGTSNGLFLMDPSTLEYHNIHPKTEEGSDVVLGNIYYLMADSRDNIWFGSGDGKLKKLSTKNHVYEEFPFTQSLSGQQDNFNNVIHCIYEDRNGCIWLSTGSSGIYKFNPNTKEFENFNERHGLANNICGGIFEDAKGYMWIGTEGGLSKLDLSTNDFHNYYREDGLPANEINRISFAKNSSDGRLFFGTTEGLMAFDPDHLPVNSIPPKVVITEVQSFRKGNRFNLQIPVNFRDLRSALKFSYKNDFLHVQLGALSYTNPKHNRYAYWLQGLSDNWIDLETERNLGFANLAPGKYNLHIKAANADGIWSEPTSLRFTIHPPWYWNMWTKILYALLAIGAIALFIRWRTSQQRKKLEEAQRLNSQLQQIDKLKDQFLANTSHELRTPLNGIIGIAESMIDGATGPLPKKSIWNLSLITSSGKRLANLINDILDFSKLRNKQLVLKKAPVDIRSAVDVVLNLSKPLVLQKEVELINEVPEDLALAEADENRLQQILHNLVGNGVKFTEAGEVKISAERQNGHIKIDVSDTGIGIREEDHEKIFYAFEQADGSASREFGGTGLGLSVTKQLVELHGGTIDVQSKVGQGSVFSFTLPTSKVGRQDYNPAVSDVKVGVVEDGSWQAAVGRRQSAGRSGSRH